MSTLRTSITELASHFAAGVLNAIRGASLEEILAETNRTGFGIGAGASAVKRGPGRPKGSGASNGAAASGAAAEKSGAKKGRRGRLGRRSASDIGAVVERIVALLGQNPKGLRAEEIRAKLGLDAKELPRPIADALAAKKISKQGEKRATTYFARGGGKAAPAATGGAKRGASAKKGAAAKPAAKAGKRGAKKAKRGPKGSRKAAAAAAASTTESAPAEAAES